MGGDFDCLSKMKQRADHPPHRSRARSRANANTIIQRLRSPRSIKQRHFQPFDFQDQSGDDVDGEVWPAGHNNSENWIRHIHVFPYRRRGADIGGGGNYD
jgi:hypothetical protein